MYTLIVYLIVSKEISEILFSFRKILKLINYTGLACALILSLPLIRKENLQSFMRKAFLDENGLGKPYRRFFIFLSVVFGLIIDLMLKLILKSYSDVVQYVVLMLLEGSCLVTFFYIVRHKFVFFFGTHTDTSIEVIKANEIVVHNLEKAKKKNYRATIDIKVLYNSGLVRKLKRNVIHCTRRGMDPSDRLQGAVNEVNDRYRLLSLEERYIGEQRVLLDRMVSSRTFGRNSNLTTAIRFWDSATMNNLRFRKAHTERQLAELMVQEPYTQWGLR
jgi:hypothetical protein